MLSGMCQVCDNRYEKTLYDLGTRWLSVRTGILEHMGGEDVALASESDDAATKRIRRPVVLKQLIEIIWNVRSEGWKWTLESGTDAPEHQDEVRLRRELDEIRAVPHISTMPCRLADRMGLDSSD